VQNHHKHIQKKLANRKDSNSYRTLSNSVDLIDFCSNDYLGLAKELEIHNPESKSTYGSTGSRLISGNSKEIDEVENFLADFYQSKSSLIFNSGYSANLGLLSCLPQRVDTVIYDEYIHASIRDGIRLSNAKAFSFSHNSIVELKNKLARAEGNVYVVVESVYSMDGDMAPLKEIIRACKLNNAALIVDEAHAVGVFGNGTGLCEELGVVDDVFARIITFGKAFGSHGAAVLGSEELKDYLINYSRPFIYTTALPLPSTIAIRKVHEYLLKNINRIEELKDRIKHFRALIHSLGLDFIDSKSAIQCLLVPGNNEVKALAKKLQLKGFDVRPILSPTVPEGKERLRICIHSYNSELDIDTLINNIADLV
jgi:8-amino-7-oxononanoate synthase